VDDVRWFAPNRYCTLPVPLLREAGLRISLEGDAPARLALAADGTNAVRGYEYAVRHRVPLVLYVWDLPPWWLGQGRPDLIFFAAGRIRKLPRLIGGYAERPGFLSRNRYVARRALQVWAPSQQTVDDLLTRFEVRAELVPFCYDSDRFQAPPDETGGDGPETVGERTALPPSEVPVILSVSRLVPQKNHATLLLAVARLGRPARVRIIGHGPEAPALRHLAQDLAVGLDLAGEWTTDEAVVEAYRQAAVVVCPSRFEGLGLTPLEALAMRRQVIVSDIPPHRQLVGDAARYFDPDDPATLARHLAAALDHPAAPPPPPHLAALSIRACAERFHRRLVGLLGGL
jgi:glycosyltransferase involved in cell wall biosynthesis